MSYEPLTEKETMKAMSKQQLADCAGVSRRTLMRWCSDHEEELQRLGLKPNAKVLPPKVVNYIVRSFCIDV
jgi:hypothetical protein